MATKVETPKTVPTIAAAIALAGDMLNGSLTLTFSNGQTLGLQLRDLSPEMIEQATLHGLKQKLVDAAAISRNPETGRSATVADKFAAVAEVHARLLAGSWNAPREGGGSAGSLLFRALCVMFEGRKDAAAVQSWLEAKTDDEKVALRKNDKVAAIIASLQAAAVSDEAKAKADAMLDELNGD